MTLRSPPRRRAALVAVFAAVLSVASAQSQVQMELGIGGNVVVGAWNPLRVVARDLPVGSRLEVTFDHGSLREGQVPFVLSLPVSGGPGLSVVERTVYVAPFHSVSWAVVGQGAIVASGSIPGRDQDETPLDVVLSRRSGVFAAALPNDARVVDVGAAQLPLDVAAYDGVRSVIVDGSTVAPRLAALAAAASAGALVVLNGPLPQSHAELELLLDSHDGRLGAGSVVSHVGSPADVAQLVITAGTLSRRALVETAAATPLVTPPSQLRQQLVIVVAIVFSVVAVLLSRVFGGPGLVSTALLAVLLSVAAWQVARPPSPQVVGTRTVALVGGELALTTRLEEHYTLPATQLNLAAHARPLDVRPYRVDESGLHLSLGGWRSVVLAGAPDVVDAPLVLQEGSLHNRGDATLNEVLVVGLGPQGDLTPGASIRPRSLEDGPAPEAYARLIADLAPGTVIALSGCEAGCTVWLAPGILGDLALGDL
ncbi:MAG TPA: hypothetical protein VFF10_10750 [Trueperaceae bacterium]|nr:hypothetical protein [Trueperaceae bacterium]